MPVFVYRNLRVRTRCLWSIGDKPKSSAAWPIVENVTLRRVTFRVSEATRLWCLANRLPSGKPYRQVHAFAIGDIHDGAAPVGERIAISYQPDGGGSFTRRDTGAAISGADYVEFRPDGAYAIDPR